MEPSGILLALTSGIVTSGMGYVLWYQVLRSLTTAQASIVQLSVPVLAAFGGVAFLSEDVSTRLVAASALILGGVALAVLKGQATDKARLKMDARIKEDSRRMVEASRRRFGRKSHQTTPHQP